MQKKLLVSAFMKQTGNEGVLKEKWFQSGYLNGSTNFEVVVMFGNIM